MYTVYEQLTFNGFVTALRVVCKGSFEKCKKYVDNDHRNFELFVTNAKGLIVY